MASDLQTRYEIELSIQGSDAVRSQCADIDRVLEEISKNARSLKFENAAKGVKDLEDYMNGLLESEEDCTAQWSEFERASTKAYNDLEKEAVKLNFSMSEAGKQQRERLKELEAEKATLGQTKEEKARGREIDKQIKEIRKQVVDASDDELSTMQRANVQARARLKMMQNEAKQRKTAKKEQKTLLQLVKDDLKPLRDKLALQKEFIKSLSTTAGKYAALKKVAKGAFAVGNTAVKGAGIAAGAVLAGVGAVLGSADTMVDKENATRRIKAGNSYKERSDLLKDVFIAAGGSNDEIVEALNRVYSVMPKETDLEKIKQAATVELKFPGVTEQLRQQNNGKAVTVFDYIAYGNRQRQMQQYTGASAEQTEAAVKYIANLPQHYFRNAATENAKAVYLALQNSGAFTEEGELQRTFEKFMRYQSTTGRNIFQVAQEWQEQGREGGWAKAVWKPGDKQQVGNVINSINFKSMGTVSRIIDYVQHYSAADETAKTARRVSIMKDDILLSILEAVEPLMPKLKIFFSKIVELVQSETFQNLISGMATVIGKILTTTSDILELMTPLLAALGGGIYKGIKRIFGDDDENPQGQSRANGGIAMFPSVFGEAGAEMAVPLSPEREGRGMQLTQELVQHFHMSGNETTTASLAAAMSSRDWAYQSGRLSSINRRMGR